MLLMLEDSPERLDRFRAVLAAIAPEATLHVWRTAREMIHEVDRFWAEATLVCLDHDLDPDDSGLDPGDGYQVVQHLTATLPPRPVLIHTSNAPRGRWMEGELELAGWPFGRVPALGDDWIEIDWRNGVHRFLKRSRSSGS